ncbi:hypothetical protein CAPTEDRAFT_208886 [Capitella teleta]|uniref:Laminin EGF-like domain-containing protein n=1 Tax=Capitella teleta TaxID=283909 RepID=R7UPQ6_CAPTE|nr:hypothetical protein CAPTEDRAFT_208886 [Capitella teleta]|eukprot:ELU08165.1 hypothetical protein CAPTEDRAFT_208886 [Capitella teleta]
MTTRKSFGIIVFVLASVFLQLAAVQGAWTSERQVAGNVTQFLIKGVQPGTNYAIFVAANFSHEPEARSIVITHQTKGYGMSKVCPCSAPGTDMSQKMDAICNYKTGVCFCKNKFFKGDRCDQCHVKYYWVNDNLGCQPCGCPEDNVRTTGACYPDGNDSVRCHCLSPYTGIKCDLCERGHFRDSKDFCIWKSKKTAEMRK